jgi:hypothetical protein
MRYSLLGFASLATLLLAPVSRAESGCPQCGAGSSCVHGHLAGVHDHFAALKEKHQQKKDRLHGALIDHKKALQGVVQDHKAKLQACLAKPKKPPHQCKRTGPVCDECQAAAAAEPVAGAALPWTPAASAQAAGVPSVQALMQAGKCVCYPPGDGRPCLPPHLPPQWIVPPCPTAATAQGQLAGSAQYAGVVPCPPTPPACCGQPSFFCPPVLLPPLPSYKLTTMGQVPLMRAIRLPAGLPSYQAAPAGQMLLGSTAGTDNRESGSDGPGPRR